MQLYRRLHRHYGDLDWWPGETPLEVSVGAILTQNTAWRNVKRAIANLKAAGALTPGAMAALPRQELAQLIVPSGYYNMKAAKLRNFLDFLYGGYGGSLNRLFALDAPRLREALLGVNGIGPETADSIILYAAKKPIFVIDAYTRRILSRHGLARGDEPYDTLRLLFEDNLSSDVSLFNEYHALIVYVGHTWCKRTPLCGECPLKIFL